MNQPVVIVGAGPAGLSCASTLAKAGRKTIIIDENIQPGGQFFRQLPQGFRSDYKKHPDESARFRALAECLRDHNIRYLPATTVWSATGTTEIAYAGPDGSGRIQASAVVLATGAQDMPLPFPGWTLPGVISAGGCLNLIKGQGLVPDGRILVAGNGPLVLVTAATLAKAGANIVSVIEAQSSTRLLSAVMKGVAKAPKVVAKAMLYRQAVFRSGARMRSGWMITGAEGEDRVEKATISPVGADGRPERHHETTLDVDLIVTGYGIIPGSEPARLFGCEMNYDASLNGMVPKRSATFETSIKGVYAVGDGAGIGGVEVAITEGCIAANGILGKSSSKRDLRRYRHLDDFRRALNRAYRPEKPLVAATQDTLVCRCEELRLSDLHDKAPHADGNLNSVKTASRLGMGRCQGRNCLPAAAALLNLSQEDLTSYPRTRPPLRPVKLSQIAGDRDACAVHEPDEPTLMKPEKTCD